ncbi:MAG TPA: ABC transporter substrate-binding protein [Oscillospiraceae bacterium]|nr:ABC transporter substrate-binding protein [Oscillospiraceae bacterium]
MKKNRILALALVFVMCFALLAGCTKTETPASETPASESPSEAPSDPIKVGVIAPLTGDVATYGIAVRDAVKLYVDTLNSNDGIGGRQVELVIYDDKGDATEATNAYNKLTTSDDVVAIIGSVTSTPTIAVAQISATDNVPMITGTATHPDVTSYGKNMFRSCFLDPFQGSTMVNFAVSQGYTTAAVIYNNSDAYSTGLYESFVASAEENGLEIVATESYGKGDSDFKTQLTNIASKSPDCLFVPDYYNTVYMIATQVKQVGLETTLLGVDGTDGVLAIDGVDTSVLEGMYFANHYSTEDPSELVQSFLKSYQDTYGETPNALAALGYDAAMILCSAMDKVSETMTIDSSDECRQAIIDAMAATDMDCVTGHVTYDENNNPQKTCAIIQITDGAYKLVGKY